MTEQTTFSFTQKRVITLKPTCKTKTYTDNKLRNLKMVVTAKGTKTYYARFKSCTKTHNIKIGDASFIRLDDARARVTELLNLHRNEDKLAAAQRPMKEYEGGRYTVNDVFDAYFRNHLMFKPTKGNQRHSLELNYTNHLKPLIGHIDVRDLNKKSLAKQLKQVAQSASHSIHNKCVIVLKAMFNYCLEFEDKFPLMFNPAISLKKISMESRSRYLTFQEARRLVEELKKLDHPIFTDLFLLTLFTGARISNVKAMTWDEVIFDDELWIVPAVKTKSKKTYHLPLSRQALDILKKRHKNRDPSSNFVFPSPTPSRSSTGYVLGGDHVWKQVIKAAGLYSENREWRIRQHDLRRTFATWQALNGTDISVISKNLGHTDIKNTQVYARLSIEKGKSAINQAFDGF